MFFVLQYKIQCVIHFAALKAVGESCEIPLEYFKTNVGGTLNLLKVMQEHGTRNFIFSSSATVYGVPEKLPLVENMKTGDCTNPYGKTKFMVEEILKDLCSSDKVNHFYLSTFTVTRKIIFNIHTENKFFQTWSVISLRYFNPVGAHPSGEIGEDPSGIPNNLMPYLSQVAVGKRESLSVYGNDYNTPDGTGVYNDFLLE